ncbi:Mitotic spindle assembly checkpoint protein like [Argiope bruennichi]|uniref:Mitotic spindle assembly checkpoint protein like n=1 Tax=Argiope bruennichi TaxID=94029 RepID=A0A8T0F8Z7_ARGBR|nr:Mitotic spindle assembly checkpoint protein like [Argiope bruennichi]
MRAAENNFNDYISGLSHTGAGGSHINAPNIAARLNFSGLDDTQIANSSMLRSFQSPEEYAIGVQWYSNEIIPPPLWCSIVKSEKTEAIRKLHMEIGSLELKVSMLTEEVQKSQEYIQSLKKKNSEMAETVALCNSYKEELKEAQAKIKELENKIEANKDAALIIASRQNDLKSLNELQKENRILKEEVAKYNCETLEKQIHEKEEIIKSLNCKLEQAQLNSSRMESVVKRFQRKILFLSKCEMEIDTLNEKLKNYAGFKSEESAPEENKLKEENATLISKISDFQKENTSLLSKICNLEKENEELKSKLSKQETINSEGIQLVETEYSKQVADKMQTYLHQHDSFPAFLASLTMDLFNQQTFMLSQ